MLGYLTLSLAKISECGHPGILLGVLFVDLAYRAFSMIGKEILVWLLRETLKLMVPEEDIQDRFECMASCNAARSEGTTTLYAEEHEEPGSA